MDNVEEMDKLLEKYNFPKLDQEEIENLNRLIYFLRHNLYNPKDNNNLKAASSAIETFHCVLKLGSRGNVSQLGSYWHLGQDIYCFVVPSFTANNL